MEFSMARPSSTTGKTPAPKPAAKPAAKRSKLSSHHRGGITESVEDYLECIANLVKRDGFVSVAAVADALDLIRPSVSQMIKRLAEMGYLKREAYRGFMLTPKGEAIATAIQARHAALTQLFMRLDLDPHQYQDDIEGIEHHLSDHTLQRLRDLIAHLDKHPLPPTP